MKKRLLTLRMDIINKCNLRCIMCHFADEHVFKRELKQFTLDEFKDMFEKIAPNVKLAMLSCGCEPLISKNLKQILNYLHTEHPLIEIELCTNAVLMDFEFRRIFIETGVSNLMISVDGISKNTFESIRIGAKFEKVISNILALRNLKRTVVSEYPKLTFNYVMLDRNIHEAPLFIEMAARMGSDVVDFHHAVPGYSNFPHHEILMSHKSKYNYYRDAIRETASRLDMTVVLPPEFPEQAFWNPKNDPNATLDDFEKIQSDPHKGSLPVPKTFSSANKPRAFTRQLKDLYGDALCMRPFTEITIREMDEILPCPWYGKPLGKLSDGKNLHEVFFGQEFSALRKRMNNHEVDPNCANCPILNDYLVEGL